MSDEQTPLFAECKLCGERWKFATLPVPLKKLGKMRCWCPNCHGGEKDVVVCMTHGPNAVKEPRAGKKS